MKTSLRVEALSPNSHALRGVPLRVRQHEEYKISNKGIYNGASFDDMTTLLLNIQCAVNKTKLLSKSILDYFELHLLP